MIYAIFAVWLLFVLAPPALSQERQRVDLFTPDGKRAGYAVIQGDRVDFFDKDSRRTGWGRLQPTGKVEQFRLDGRRQGETVLPLLMPEPKRR